MFSGSVTSLANSVHGQLQAAMRADGEDRRYAERSVGHLLAHLPTRAALEEVLELVAAPSEA